MICSWRVGGWVLTLKWKCLVSWPSNTATLQHCNTATLQHYHTVPVRTTALMKQSVIYRMQQASFLSYIASSVQKRKLACRTVYILCPTVQGSEHGSTETSAGIQTEPSVYSSNSDRHRGSLIIIKPGPLCLKLSTNADGAPLLNLQH
jgi:hypothetical protein